MALRHRKADTSKRRTNKNNKNKTKYIKGTLKTKDFDNLKATVTVQLAEDTNPRSKRVAWGSLVIGGCFVIYISVYEGKKGYFISYPNYEGNDGEYHDLAYCMDSKVIKGLKNLISEMIDGDEDDEDEDDEDEDDEDDEDEDDDDDLPF